MKINLEIIKSAYLIGKNEVDNLNTKELVPKMVFRRRLTRASKLVIELMNKVEFDSGRVMYSSGFGELPATANILNSILNEQMISPTDFQNSVYNTAVSYSSILQKNEHEVMTISCGENSGEKLLKLGAIKALDGDEILLVATETINIDNISEINSCIDYLESAVALRVKVTNEKANILSTNIEKGLPKSLSNLIEISKACEKQQKNIIEINI